ncbi:MAG: hypothetical protein PF574_01085 [Candidatus Delongbacteria bacterium]|jgi:hypothetical protein|nr:hypothetical protein [Candidatus Delongbacteria bacterium]
MKNLLIVVGILFLLGVSSNVLAQGFTFHGTMAFPQTDFGNDKAGEENAGFANMGFGGGIEFLSSELGKKFYWIGSLNFLHHGVGDDLYQIFDDLDSTSIVFEPDNVGLTAYNCMYLTTGVRFKNMFDRKKKEFGMYIDGQIGMSMVYGPNYDYSYDNGTPSDISDDIEESIDWDLSNSFTFSIGAGFVLWSKVLIGVKYVNLTSLDFDGTFNDVIGGFEKDVKLKQSISTISLNLGLTFQN